MVGGGSLWRAAASALVLLVGLVSVTACSGVPGKELQAIGSELTPQSVDFTGLVSDAQMALAAYQKEPAIRAAYPKTVRVASPGTRDVQYFIVRDDKARTQYISVRGTADDLNIREDFDLKVREDRKIKIPVHSGFDADARAVYGDAKSNLKKGYSTYFIGHSLGGAVAAVAAIYAIEDGFDVKRVTTFGQPRFTTTKGVQQLSFLPLLRVVDENDLVPLLPPGISLNDGLGHYEQVGPEVLLLEGQEFVYLPAPAASELSLGEFWRDLGVADLQDHKLREYIARLTAKERGAKQVTYNSREHYAALRKSAQSLKQR